MTQEPRRGRLSRRGLITGLAATAGAAGVGAALVGGGRADGAPAAPAAPPPAGAAAAVPFHGVHQPGIETPQQRYAMFVAFDLETTDKDRKPLPAAKIAAGFRSLMEQWTGVAERLMAGRPPGARPGSRPESPPGSGIADGLAPAGLTLTFGLGPELFPRIGRESLRPGRLRPLPAFPGDRLRPAWCGGELLVQICADDPQVVSHAFRALRSRAPGIARLRWTQQGFLGTFGDATPRNLFGHKDGTANPRPGTDPFDQAVWAAGTGEPAWFAGGTYLVFRKIRMDLPKWDTSTAREQDEAIGRRRDNGAPLSGGHEFTAADFARTGADGKPVIPADSHVALLQGISMLRRSYNYDYAFQGLTEPLSAEDVPEHEHPPGTPLHDHAGGGHDSYDSGTLFCAYVRDPEEFVRAQLKLVGTDRLNAFIQHTGSAVFAIPPGVQPGGTLAQALFA
ncbi:Dyp-type peroxidase [Bailinhaonella thermotolerans]|uniref:Dyp-type peroxidase n=1 Tax=Bailinhaonella thermotolerans TaxID=1070861 RepID=A0A3A4AAB8_9ACTN|nr:Dyp-type peroxidase [Bailinhaonella thermotolerans]RJL22990.1 Dyp-type peroxidase [Bailinhaonella thermotolerans]